MRFIDRLSGVSGSGFRVGVALAEPLERRRLLSAVISTLNNFNGQMPAAGNLVMDTAGNLFGSLNNGGVNNTGMVFELSGSSRETFTTLISGPKVGSAPTDLTFDSSGNLYAVTSTGGQFNDGTLCELTGANHQTQTTLISFNGTDGDQPYGLMTDAAGDVYGVTFAGGGKGDGTVFEYSPGNQPALTTLVNLNAADTNPLDGVVVDGAGNIYGITGQGGAPSGTGSVFELSGPGHQTVTTLVSFNSGGGSIDLGGYPTAGLTIDAAGNLYGMTSQGGTMAAGSGVVFELSGPGHLTITKLEQFTGMTPPVSQLTLDAGGNLYGVAEFDGGAPSDGFVFELSGTNHQTFTPIADFEYTDPLTYGGRVIVDAEGNLYGTTSVGDTNSGGANIDGTVWELSGANDQTLTTLVNFSRTAGFDPTGQLSSDAQGDLFGVTWDGGTFGCGTVFEMSSADRQTLNTVFSFNGTDGQIPQSVTVGPDGNLYGITAYGGDGYSLQDGDASGDGTVFELSGSGFQTLTTLVTFNGTNGLDPDCKLAFDAASNIYGTTSDDDIQVPGVNGYGRVFELSGAGHATFINLHQFTGTDGRYPSSVSFDSAGNLYGTTLEGGLSGEGNAFELSGPDHQTFTTLVNFNGANGSNPQSGLTIDSSGNLYGTTDVGSVYELSGSSHQTLTTLLNLSSSEGDNLGGVLIDAAGNLFVQSSNSVIELSGASRQNVAVIPGLGSSNSSVSSQLTADAAGNLYGLTTYNGGTAFEVTGSGLVTSPVVVAAGQTSDLSQNPGSGILVETIPGLSIGTGGAVGLDAASSPANRQLLVVNGTGLSIAGSTNQWTGLLDLADNDLDVAGGSLATTTNQIAQGYAHGTWLGTGLSSGGITSSSAAGDSANLTALGVIQNNQSGTALFTAANPFDGTTPGPSDILIKYTYYGDANLDGKVDGSDYSLIDNGLLKHLTGWLNGDFNYDGVINGSDYTLIDNAFNQQGASLAASVANPEGQIQTSGQSTGGTAKHTSVFTQSPGAASTSQQARFAVPVNIALAIFSSDRSQLHGKFSVTQILLG